MSKNRSIIDIHHLNLTRAVGTPGNSIRAADDNPPVRLHCDFGSGLHEQRTLSRVLRREREFAFWLVSEPDAASNAAQG